MRVRLRPFAFGLMVLGVVAILYVSDSHPAPAAILVTSGDVSFQTPATVRLGGTESDTELLAFDEKDFTLPSVLNLGVSRCGFYDSTSQVLASGPPVIFPGTSVESHLIHGDAVGTTGAVLLSGTVRFRDPIVAVIFESDDLDAGQEFQHAGVLYPSSGSEAGRGIELDTDNDQFEIDCFTNSISVQLSIGEFSDQVRVLTAPPAPVLTTRVSVSSAEVEGDNNSIGYEGVSISSDGRFVAFVSRANNLATSAPNSWSDVFVRDRMNGTTEQISSDGNTGTVSPPSSYAPSLSGDGRFVAYLSQADNVVPGDGNGIRDAFVYDRTTGTTTRISEGLDGCQAANAPSINEDGTYISFATFGFGEDCGLFVFERVAERGLGSSRPMSRNSSNRIECFLQIILRLVVTGASSPMTRISPIRSRHMTNSPKSLCTTSLQIPSNWRVLRMARWETHTHH